MIAKKQRMLTKDGLALLSIYGSSSLQYSEYFQQNPKLLVRNKTNCRNSLKVFWHIGDKESMIRHMDWIIETGYREEYNMLHKRFSMMTDSACQAYIHRLAADSTTRYQAGVVYQYLYSAPAAGIVAYDYALALYSAYAGAMAGYLTQDEKNHYVSRIIQQIQQEITGPHDYVLGYMIGVQYVQTEADPEHMAKHKIAFTKMITSAKSLLYTVSFWKQSFA
ncbi:DUF1266 domain-containing protein [Paenibacillus bovis]|uniref:DUF1266 domain-containing protein n=1 Tax=Paenibacillus bovis TaxID=1616788 RepID=A0A172ZJ56_9BACL|nr:DUF1266 domain-containing protein [Paenibacillus bovis]ANF97569.1 hypothetical protein AR543_17180 [Paenibacillus bovis]